VKLSDRRKWAFLKELQLHGIQTGATRAASPRTSSPYGAIQTFKGELERDPEFARQWDEAMRRPRPASSTRFTGARKWLGRANLWGSSS
jgi:hypothetical protein